MQQNKIMCDNKILILINIFNNVRKLQPKEALKVKELVVLN